MAENIRESDVLFEQPMYIIIVNLVNLGPMLCFYRLSSGLSLCGNLIGWLGLSLVLINRLVMAPSLLTFRTFIVADANKRIWWRTQRLWKERERD